MVTREQWRRFIDHPLVEWSLFGVGVLLLLLTPLVGVIPGPGGIVTFALGLALVLKTSMWAKRRYVRFKRWQPKAGSWSDWALRRRSELRRRELRRQAEPALPTGDDPANIAQAPAQPPGAAPIEIPADPWPDQKAGSN